MYLYVQYFCLKTIYKVNIRQPGGLFEESIFQLSIKKDNLIPDCSLIKSSF